MGGLGWGGRRGVQVWNIHGPHRARARPLLALRLIPAPHLSPTLPYPARHPNPK